MSISNINTIFITVNKRRFITGDTSGFIITSKLCEIPMYIQRMSRLERIGKPLNEIYKMEKKRYEKKEIKHYNKIQYSINKSKFYLITIEPMYNKDNLRDIIINNEFIDNKTKMKLCDYQNNNETFTNLLINVLLLIDRHNAKEEIYKILCKDINNSIYERYWDKTTILIKCLKGFDKNIVINLSDNDNILYNLHHNKLLNNVTQYLDTNTILTLAKVNKIINRNISINKFKTDKYLPNSYLTERILMNLVYLDVSNTINIREIINFPKLETLIADGSNICKIQNCNELKNINISNTKDMREIINFPKLETLIADVSNICKIEYCNELKNVKLCATKHTIDLNKLNKLEILDISWSKITSDNIKKCVNLTELDISVTPKHNMDLNTLKKLKRLTAIRSSLTDASIMKCLDIRYLDISYLKNNFNLSHLKKLNCLYVYNFKKHRIIDIRECLDIQIIFYFLEVK
jgi:hypothetical protein